MHTVDILLKRRSVRKFKPDPVPWDSIYACCNAGLHAPVAGNVHNVKYVTVRDKGTIQKIAQACHEQTWLGTAPCLIVVCVEPYHQDKVYGARGARFYTIQNAAAAAMSIIIAAESLGLATCWVGAFDEDQLRPILGYPEDVHAHVVIPVGYPDEQPKKPVKQWPRGSVFLEGWWGSRKLPPHGRYSHYNKQAWGATVAGARKAIDDVKEKIIKRKKT